MSLFFITSGISAPCLGGPFSTALYLTNPSENLVVFLSQPHPGSHTTCSAANRKGSKLTLTSCLMRETFDFLLPLNEIYSNTYFEQRSSQVHFKGQKNVIDKIANQQISELLSLTWAWTGSLRCPLPWEVRRAELCVRILQGNKERGRQKMEIKGTRSFPNNTDFHNSKKQRNPRLQALPCLYMRPNLTQGLRTNKCF